MNLSHEDFAIKKTFVQTKIPGGINDEKTYLEWKKEKKISHGQKSNKYFCLNSTFLIKNKVKFQFSFILKEFWWNSMDENV